MLLCEECSINSCRQNFEKLQFQNLELYQKWSPLRLIVQKLASDLSVCFLLLFFFSGNG